MRFLKENDEKLKTYLITYGTKFSDGESEWCDIEYDEDFPGYTIVKAVDRDAAVTMFENKPTDHYILNIREINEEYANEIKSRLDYVNFNDV